MVTVSNQIYHYDQDTMQMNHNIIQNHREKPGKLKKVLKINIHIQVQQNSLNKKDLDQEIVLNNIL